MRKIWKFQVNSIAYRVPRELSTSAHNEKQICIKFSDAYNIVNSENIKHVKAKSTLYWFTEILFIIIVSMKLIVATITMI